MRAVLLALLLVVLTAAPASAHLRYCGGKTMHTHWKAGSSVQVVERDGVRREALVVPRRFASYRLIRYTCPRS